MFSHSHFTDVKIINSLVLCTAHTYTNTQYKQAHIDLTLLQKVKVKWKLCRSTLEDDGLNMRGECRFMQSVNELLTQSHYYYLMPTFSHFSFALLISLFFRAKDQRNEIANEYSTPIDSGHRQGNEKARSFMLHTRKPIQWESMMNAII